MKKQISKTKITKRKNKKTNLELVKTIENSKNKNFLELAKRLTRPTRLQSKISLNYLNSFKEGETFLIAGKVLGQGELDKKLKIYALGFSEQAKEKIKKSGSEMGYLKDFIEKNDSIKGVQIL
jgi:large subunit ribosomal protein L18e